MFRSNLEGRDNHLFARKPVGRDSDEEAARIRKAGEKALKAVKDRKTAAATASKETQAAAAVINAAERRPRGGGVRRVQGRSLNL